MKTDGAPGATGWRFVVRFDDDDDLGPLVHCVRAGAEHRASERQRGLPATTLEFSRSQLTAGLPWAMVSSRLGRAHPPQPWARDVMPIVHYRRLWAFDATGDPRFVTYRSDAATPDTTSAYAALLSARFGDSLQSDVLPYPHDSDFGLGALALPLKSDRYDQLFPSRSGIPNRRVTLVGLALVASEFETLAARPLSDCPKSGPSVRLSTNIEAVTDPVPAFDPANAQDWQVISDLLLERGLPKAGAAARAEAEALASDRRL